ncbi:MAG: F-box protein [Verrucomicrobia bacterium]|nr:F-box protein [Verrucomicrobiota bacterium]
MISSINDLPPELLGKIFGHCDKEELHKCRLVCKKWQTAVDTIHSHKKETHLSKEKIKLSLLMFETLFVLTLAT